MAVAADTDNALITIDDALREYLGITAGDTTYDDRLQAVINAISKFANNYTRRLLKARDLTEYYDGTGLDTMFLDNWPVNSLTSLYIDSDRGYGSDTLIDTDDYTWYDTGKIVLDGSIFTESAKAIKVVYNGGYATIPWDLQQAAREWLLSVWQRDDKNLINVESITSEGQSVSYAARLMPEFTLATLNFYRRPVTNG